LAYESVKERTADFCYISLSTYQVEAKRDGETDREYRERKKEIDGYTVYYILYDNFKNAPLKGAYAVIYMDFV